MDLRRLPSFGRPTTEETASLGWTAPRPVPGGQRQQRAGGQRARSRSVRLLPSRVSHASPKLGPEQCYSYTRLQIRSILRGLIWLGAGGCRMHPFRMMGEHGYRATCAAAVLMALLAHVAGAGTNMTAAAAAVLNDTAAPATAVRAPVPRLPSEISPTVSIFFLEDLIPFADEPESNVCIEMVKRASSFSARRLNFGAGPRPAARQGSRHRGWHCWLAAGGIADMRHLLSAGAQSSPGTSRTLTATASPTSTASARTRTPSA